jgi:hypothetical protein
VSRARRWCTCCARVGSGAGRSARRSFESTPSACRSRRSSRPHPVREGDDLVWRFTDLDPEQDIGLLVSPFPSMAAVLGLEPYWDIRNLHERRPAAGTLVVVGGYFREPPFLLGERSRDLNIAVPDGISVHEAVEHAEQVGVHVRGLEQAVTTQVDATREMSVWKRDIIIGRVAYEGERLVIEAERRVELGRAGLRSSVPERFAWVCGGDPVEGRTIPADGAWPPYVSNSTVKKLAGAKGRAK